MKLPLLVSVSHAGLRIPQEAVSYNVLDDEAVRRDGDEGAAAIYSVGELVSSFVTTDIARAIVDVNRREQDLSDDGAIKRCTIYGITVYSTYPPQEVIQNLIRKYHRPYHDALSRSARFKNIKLGLDCHTMAQYPPPISPDDTKERPHICLSDLGGRSCPADYTRNMARCLEEAFGFRISINDPFRGGYILKRHHHEIPWLQLELSRAAFLSIDEKRRRFIETLRNFVDSMDWPSHNPP